MYNDFKEQRVEQENTQPALPAFAQAVPQQPIGKKPKRFGASVVAFGLFCAVLGGAVGGAGVAVFQENSTPSTTLSTGSRPTIVSTAHVNGEKVPG